MNKAASRALSREQLQNSLVLPRRCLVEVRRDITETISKLVYEHEVDILREVHGEGNVAIVEDPLQHNILIAPIDVVEAARAEARKASKKGQRVVALFMHTEHPMRWEPADEDQPGDVGKWVMDPVYVGDEMNRLRTVYGMHHEKKEFFVDVVYPHERDLVEACDGVYRPAENGKPEQVKGAA